MSAAAPPAATASTATTEPGTPTVARRTENVIAPQWLGGIDTWPVLSASTQSQPSESASTSIPVGNGSSVKSGWPGTGGSGAGAAGSKSESVITTDLVSKPLTTVAPSTERPWPIASGGLPGCWHAVAG